MKQTITLNESQLKQIVAETVKKVLSEGLFLPTEFDNNVAQKAQKPSDVFKLNYWTGRTVSKGNGSLVIQCFTDNNSMATRNYPDFSKVLNDLREYYRLHGSNTVVEQIPGDSDRGVFIRLTKKA